MVLLCICWKAPLWNVKSCFMFWSTHCRCSFIFRVVQFSLYLYQKHYNVCFLCVDTHICKNTRLLSLVTVSIIAPQAKPLPIRIVSGFCVEPWLLFSNISHHNPKALKDHQNVRPWAVHVYLSEFLGDGGPKHSTNLVRPRDHHAQEPNMLFGWNPSLWFASYARCTGGPAS